MFRKSKNLVKSFLWIFESSIAMAYTFFGNLKFFCRDRMISLMPSRRVCHLSTRVSGAWVTCIRFICPITECTDTLEFSVRRSPFSSCISSCIRCDSVTWAFLWNSASISETLCAMSNGVQAISSPDRTASSSCFDRISIDSPNSLGGNRPRHNGASVSFIFSRLMGAFGRKPCARVEYIAMSLDESFALRIRANIRLSVSGGSRLRMFSTHWEPEMVSCFLEDSSTTSRFSSTIMKTYPS
mmetsp:Transcript_25852/g.62073  ORF Transcript_25852/g.62073 Transcript_25852/m.62073 type:complete len:241 (+) Transcript_25852:898-1620(+)